MRHVTQKLHQWRNTQIRGCEKSSETQILCWRFAAMECCGDGFLDFCGGRRPKGAIILVIFHDFSAEFEGEKSWAFHEFFGIFAR